MIVKCPNCGSTDIREKNLAYAELKVLDWEWDVESENLVRPADYDTDASVDWEVMDHRHQYVCHRGAKDGKPCTWQGQLADLAVEGDAHD